MVAFTIALTIVVLATIVLALIALATLGLPTFGLAALGLTIVGLAIIRLTALRLTIIGLAIRLALLGYALGGTLLAAFAGLGVATLVRLLAALTLLRLAGLLAGLAVLAFPTLATRNEAAHGLDHAEIMVGVLEIGFGEDAIAGGCRFTGQRLVFVEDLVGIAADPDIGTTAIENLVSIGRAIGAVMLGLVMVIVATTAAAAATIATATRPLTIVWSH